MYQDYDTHHDHGDGWHWHRDGSGNSYEDKHNSNLGACNHADAWVGGCIGVGNPDPPVEEDLYTLYHDHLDYYGIGKHLLHRHLKTEGDNDGDHYHDPPEQSDDEPFVSRRNDVIHSHNYTDLDPDDPANVNVNEWHQHKKEARGDDGSFGYAESSHHGSAQRDSGHDGSVDNPEPSDFDFEPGILPEMEVVTPYYPVKPVVDTVKPTAPTEIMETLDEVKDQEPVIPESVEQIVEEMPEPEVEDMRESETYEFHQGWNLVMFALLPEDVTTLAELYPHLESDVVLAVNVAGCWLMYKGEGETGDVKLHPNMGVAVYAPMPFSLTLIGHRIKLVTSFPIHAGLNLIGFSLPPPEIAKPSDLLSETGICAVVRVIDGGFQIIGRAGDSGDTDFAPNEAFMVISPVSYDLEWQIAAAPMAPHAATLATLGGNETMGYNKQIGYDIQTRSRQRVLPWLDGEEWQWVLYQNGNWAGNSPFHYGSEQGAHDAGFQEAIKRGQ